MKKRSNLKPKSLQAALRVMMLLCALLCLCACATTDGPSVTPSLAATLVATPVPTAAPTPAPDDGEKLRIGIYKDARIIVEEGDEEDTYQLYYLNWQGTEYYLAQDTVKSLERPKVRTLSDTCYEIKCLRGYSEYTGEEVFAHHVFDSDGGKLLEGVENMLYAKDGMVIYVEQRWRSVYYDLVVDTLYKSDYTEVFFLPLTEREIQNGAIKDIVVQGVDISVTYAGIDGRWETLHFALGSDFPEWVFAYYEWMQENGHGIDNALIDLDFDGTPELLHIAWGTAGDFYTDGVSFQNGELVPIDLYTNWLSATSISLCREKGSEEWLWLLEQEKLHNNFGGGWWKVVDFSDVMC